MNNQLTEMHGTALNTQRIVPASLSAIRPMYWSVRRELWENRSIYIAPLIMAGVIPFGFLIGITQQLPKLRTALLDPVHQHATIDFPYDITAFLIMVTGLITGVFYCLDALYGERRDRSIHFWKSMPVSDLTTVLAKAVIPLVFLPLVTFAIIIATHLVILLLSLMILPANGLSDATLLAQLFLFNKWIALFYALTVSALWYAPIFSWLLIVSAWAKRTTFLWAVLPPLAIVLIGTIAFNNSYIVNLAQYRLFGWYSQAFDLPAPDSAPTANPWTYLALGKFLSTPGLWIGLAVAAVFLALAIRARRYRGPL